MTANRSISPKRLQGDSALKRYKTCLSQEKSKEERVRVPFVIFLAMTWNIKPVKEKLHKRHKESFSSSQILESEEAFPSGTARH